MSTLHSNLAAFVMLKEASQKTEEHTGSYDRAQYIPPLDGIRIYIRAVDKIEACIKEVVQKSTRAAMLSASSDPQKQLEKTQTMAEITNTYWEAHTVLEEFIRGFSVTHDESIKDIMSLCYRAFHYTLQRFRLGFVGNNVAYYEEGLSLLARARAMFVQMEGILTAQEGQTLHSEPHDNDV